MMEKTGYEEALAIISTAGDVKYHTSLAKKRMSAGDFLAASDEMEEAAEQLKLVHDMFREQLQDKLDNPGQGVGLLTVHAQTHMALAQEAVEQAEDMMRLYQKIYDLERELDTVKGMVTNRNIRILLICAEGVSSSLMVNYMRQYATSLDVIEAASVNHLRMQIDKYDVVLTGPHMRHKNDMIKKICEMHGKAFGMIPPEVYGRMDGKAALEQAKKLKEAEEGKTG